MSAEVEQEGRSWLAGGMGSLGLFNQVFAKGLLDRSVRGLFVYQNSQLVLRNLKPGSQYGSHQFDVVPAPLERRNEGSLVGVDPDEEGIEGRRHGGRLLGRTECERRGGFSRGLERFHLRS